MQRRETDIDQPQRDQGAALVLTMVMILVAMFIVIPILNYAVAVTRASRLVDAKAQRIEAVKGGLRTALAEPVELYKTCAGATWQNPAVAPNVPRDLGSPALSVGVVSTCYVMQVNAAENPAFTPFGAAGIQAVGPTTDLLGVEPLTLPTYFADKTNVFVDSHSADLVYWQTQTSLTRLANTIWGPNLPVHPLNLRSETPYEMPIEFGACRVYFPGTYTTAVTITDATPVYFTSGIYYFEEPLTISGDANVVVGGGSIEGCTTDQEAAFYSIDAPTTHAITGLGATFVFGYKGRLAIDNSTPAVGTAGLRMEFNQRYVHEDDVNSLPSETVNIMSVNGNLPGSDLNAVLEPLFIDQVISVPASLAPADDGTFGPATINRYRPSTLIPPVDLITNPASPDSAPIVHINLTTGAPASVTVPGYVGVPQGRFVLNVAAGLGANKDIDFTGGILSRRMEFTGDQPADFRMGVFDTQPQLEVRIISETTSGSPKVVSDAIVQINKNGAYAVNSWSVQ